MQPSSPVRYSTSADSGAASNASLLAEARATASGPPMMMVPSDSTTIILPLASITVSSPSVAAAGHGVWGLEGSEMRCWGGRCI